MYLADKLRTEVRQISKKAKLKHHPDKNMDNVDAASLKFRRVTEASVALEICGGNVHVDELIA